MAIITKNKEVPHDLAWLEVLKEKHENSIVNAYAHATEAVEPFDKIGEVTSTPKILLARHLSNKSKVVIDNVIPNPEYKTTNYTISLRDQELIQRDASGVLIHDTDDPTTPSLKLKAQPRPKGQDESNNPEKPFLKRLKPQAIKNLISIINYSVSPYISLDIQGMPSEVEVSPDTVWATVKSPGRNNPFYIYSGAEDTISLEVTWFSNNKDNRDEVLLKCKLLESWSKANGHSAAPPILDIVWGSSDLFRGEKFILHSAKYTLGNFQNAYEKDNRVVDLKLMPQSAKQTLVFKRVTNNNLTHEEIISSSKLQNVTGLKYGSAQ